MWRRTAPGARLSPAGCTGARSQGTDGGGARRPLVASGCWPRRARPVSSASCRARRACVAQDAVPLCRPRLGLPAPVDPAVLCLLVSPRSLSSLAPPQVRGQPGRAPFSATPLSSSFPSSEHQPCSKWWTRPCLCPARWPASPELWPVPPASPSSPAPSSRSCLCACVWGAPDLFQSGVQEARAGFPCPEPRPGAFQAIRVLDRQVPGRHHPHCHCAW